MQKLREKIGTAVIFLSEKGCAKDIFTDFLVDQVIGQRSAITIRDIDQITARFNVVMEKKFLTVCDEGLTSEDVIIQTN